MYPLILSVQSVPPIHPTNPTHSDFPTIYLLCHPCTYWSWDTHMRKTDHMRKITDYSGSDYFTVDDIHAPSLPTWWGWEHAMKFVWGNLTLLKKKTWPPHGHGHGADFQCDHRSESGRDPLEKLLQMPEVIEKETGTRTLPKTLSLAFVLQWILTSGYFLKMKSSDLWSFCVCLLSFRTMFLRLILVGACISRPFTL